MSVCLRCHRASPLVVLVLTIMSVSGATNWARCSAMSGVVFGAVRSVRAAAADQDHAVRFGVGPRGTFIATRICGGTGLAKSASAAIARNPAVLRELCCLASRWWQTSLRGCGQATESWGWLGLAGKTPIFTSPFGDVFFRADDGSTALTREQVAVDVDGRHVSAEVRLHGQLPENVAGLSVRVTFYRGVAVHIEGGDLNFDTDGAPVNSVDDFRFAGVFFLIGGTFLVGADALIRSVRSADSQ